MSKELILDTKLKFNEHFDDKINKCNRIIGLIKKLALILPTAGLLTIYKAFVRPNLQWRTKYLKQNVVIQ